MDAIMAVLVVTLLANADGRYGRLLSALVDARPDRRMAVILFFGAFAILAIASAIGALLAGAMLGLGVLNLFAAMALASAAGALMWQPSRASETARLVAAKPPMLLILLLMLQLGDRNQFLIFALGALSGAAYWSVAGSGAGLLVAMLPVLALGPAMLERRGAQACRWTAAAILLLWAGIMARAAFGV